MKTLWIMLLAVALPLAAVCAAENNPDATAVVAGNTAFALDLYGRLHAQPGNLFFSPYSISTAVAMTDAGARGATATQIAQTMHIDLPQDKLQSAFAAMQADITAIQQNGHVQLSVANSLWPGEHYHFLPAYLALLKQDYDTVVTPLDFAKAAAATHTINEWVETKTNRKITDLIKPGIITKDTRMVLVNAIYFKGHWGVQFDPKATQPQPFHVTADQTVSCQMMSRSGDYPYAETPTLQLLELPYAGKELSMIVLLPKQLDGLAALEASLTPANLADWTKALDDSAPGGAADEKVIVKLPKFKLTCEFTLGATLAAMGMTDAFGSKADFSGMDGTHSLALSEAVHKAFVDVQEEGTEAAAATAFVFMAGGMPHPTPEFRADHPFLFLIREKHTGSILFIGRMVAPPA